MKIKNEEYRTIWYKENVVEMVWKYFDKNNSDLLTIRVDSNDCN